MHLTPAEVTEYVDGVATPDASARIQSHLAECAECRDEVVETGEIVAATRRPTWIRASRWAPVAAAAALVFMLVRPTTTPTPAPDTHREAPINATIVPTIVAPVGDVDSLAVLVWRAVPTADGYDARIFDGKGSVVWEQSTQDTTARPRELQLAPGATYYAEIRALVGYNRFATSEQVPFSVKRQE